LFPRKAKYSFAFTHCCTRGCGAQWDLGIVETFERCTLERWENEVPYPLFSVSVASEGLRYAVSLLFATLTGMSACVAFKRLTRTGRWRGGDARSVEKEKAPPTPPGICKNVKRKELPEGAFVRMRDQRSYGGGISVRVTRQRGWSGIAAENHD